MKDLKRVQIVSSDTASASVRVLAMDGERLHGISAIDVRMRPNMPAEATITLWVGNVSMHAEAKWCAHHPLTNKLCEIQHIEFVDEAPVWARENKLVVVGWLGIRRAYLNVSREEAVARWMRDSGDTVPPPEDKVEEITFTDEFGVYDAWGPSR